jgi:hypothetical protein
MVLEVFLWLTSLTQSYLAALLLVGIGGMAVTVLFARALHVVQTGQFKSSRSALALVAASISFALCLSPPLERNMILGLSALSLVGFAVPVLVVWCAILLQRGRSEEVDSSSPKRIKLIFRLAIALPVVYGIASAFSGWRLAELLS